MSTTHDHDDGQGADKSMKALEAERAGHKETKAKHSEHRRAIAKTLGLQDDAPWETITTALSNTDAAKLVEEKTAALRAELQTERERSTKLEGDWNAQRIDTAIVSALANSRMIAANHEDAATLLRGVLEVREGKVVTKTAPNIVPGQSAEQFIVGQLQTMRGHWWPRSVSGGARGGSGAGLNSLGDTSCFDPKSPKFNLTEQGRYFRRYGPIATEQAKAQYGGGR